MTDAPDDQTRADDELDGCEKDFTVDPSYTFDSERLLDADSQDRTEKEEALRHAV